jgi:hypothetical protein
VVTIACTAWCRPLRSLLATLESDDNCLDGQAMRARSKSHGVMRAVSEDDIAAAIAAVQATGNAHAERHEAFRSLFGSQISK